MAFRRVLEYPDRTLLKESVGVSKFDADTVAIVTDLCDTLNVVGGVGLSAPQIGFHSRIIYVKAPSFVGEMINPVILDGEGKCLVDEGCLSLPGLIETVERYHDIKVRYQDVDGEKIESSFSGLAAQIIQHEIEHLDGVLMLSHLSRLRRSMAVKRLNKQRKKESASLFVEEPVVGRHRKNAHLTRKEIKKRRRQRKQNK